MATVLPAPLLPCQPLPTCALPSHKLGHSIRVASFRQQTQYYMRQYSDDQQGFIASDIEIKNKYSLKLAALHPPCPPPNPSRIRYRFSDHFLKKEHSLALQTPLSLAQQPLSADPEVGGSSGVEGGSSPRAGKSKPKHYQHPYQYYCRSNEFSLVYSKHGEQPFTLNRDFMKREVPLLNLDDKGSPSLKELKSFQEQEIEGLEADDLRLDSKFESGNLHCGFRRRGSNEYHLFMENDTNTLGYNQWFYFAMSGPAPRTTYTFRILNYRKRLRFFEEGQRIQLFSLREAEHRPTGWRIAGHHYSVEESPVRGSPDKTLFTLSFSIEFQHPNDYVALASSLPYSYSKLLRELKVLQAQAGKSPTASLTIETAGTTVCGNQVPQITIAAREIDKKARQRRLIVVIARQHPGEIWSSYLAEGLMRALLKDSPESKYLLQNFVVKILPMVNVDGVILGNFRCDVTGVDLNRHWKQPSRVFHPHLNEIKKRFSAYNKRSRIELCLDLHGHSKKYNVFCYGCKHNPYSCRLLPLLLEQFSPMFHMPSCTFGLSKDKQTTARATLSRLIRSENVLTIQTSAFGWTASAQPQQFRPYDIMRLAQNVCMALRFFLDKSSKEFRQAERNVHANFQRFKQFDQQNLEESGSDSEPEQDEIDFKTKLATVFDKKHEQEYRSFLKEDLTAHLHRNQMVLNLPNSAHSQQPLTSKELSASKDQSASKELQLEQLHYPQGRQIRQSSRRLAKVARKNISLKSIEEKKSMSLNHSEIGAYLHASELQKVNRNLPRSILIRQRKKPSISKQTNLQLTLNPRELREEAALPKDPKDDNIEEEKRAIQGFVHRFQRFIPSNMALKNKGKFDLLQEGLEHDDSSYQLNLLYQNKRRIELQRIKKSIEESTEIVERQGKLKKAERKDPIVNFKTFKQNQRLKQQLKRLGEISERYLEGNR